MFTHTFQNESSILQYTVHGKKKGKVRPRTHHEGPEGGRGNSSILPLTSALEGGGWSTPRPAGTHCIGGWVDPRAGLDGCEKSRPHRDSIPGPSSEKETHFHRPNRNPTRITGTLHEDLHTFVIISP